MAECSVEICRIEKFDVHPAADMLELAQIKGWQVVVPIAKYRATERNRAKVGRVAMKYIGDQFLFSKAAERDTHDI